MLAFFFFFLTMDFMNFSVMILIFLAVGLVR